MKRRIDPGLGFGSYPTAWRTIQGYETMYMMRKGQVEGVETGNIQAQNEFIPELFGLAAQLHIDHFILSCPPDIYSDYLQHNPFFHSRLRPCQIVIYKQY